LLWGYENSFSIVGNVDNLLAPTHPIHNISIKAARSMIHYFYKDQIEPLKDIIPKFEDPLEEVGGPL
jgi:protein farnesyltransferase subunit beta